MSKDNPTQAYFDAEMRYLREAAKEFASQFPDRAAMLNLDKTGARDPSVEHLFQGFAFLMGRMREKLDDDFPELSEGLVDMVRPECLRMVPSLSVVELAPDVNTMKDCQTIHKGFEVRSKPVGPLGTRCRYTTTQDLALRALALDAVKVGQAPDGRSTITLRFSRGRLMQWDCIDLQNIPLYLDGSEAVATALHHALSLNSPQIYLRREGAERELHDVYFAVKGFSEDDRLWPRGDSQDGDHQLWLEYFSFPEKFMFLRLKGLEQVTFEPSMPWIELEVILHKPWPRSLALSHQNVRLHAVPVINAFALEVPPLTLDPLQSEYLLRPMDKDGGHVEIYSVDSVIAAKSSARHKYVPFSRFQHKGGMLPNHTPGHYYHTRLKRAPSGAYDTWLILGGDGFELDRSKQAQTLSLKLTGTNGHTSRMALTKTVLDERGHSHEAQFTVRNLCAPTMPFYPPDKDRFHWQVLSHLGPNFLPMLDSAEVLRNTLALYDWTGDERNRHRLQGIVEVKHHLLQRFEKGFLLRGVDIEVTLDGSRFAGEGDMVLFGLLLNHFFAQYADIHLFNQLTLVMLPEKKCLRWDENHSQRVPG